MRHTHRWDLGIHSVSSAVNAASVRAAEEDAALRRLASNIVLGAALVLIAAKFWGWMVIDSVALLTSAADGVADALAAAATFFGVRFAQRPADSMHRYGHDVGAGCTSDIKA
jgi:ferrous-iron efflux pump FieF